jgi:HEAT repeat protein
MAVSYFCPACWREIPPGIPTCEECGADLIAEDARPFTDKLVHALRHPIPETAARAAWILGERCEEGALDDLLRVLEETDDRYLAEAAAEALGKIGNARATGSLRRAEKTGAVRVRRAAREALGRIQAAASNQAEPGRTSKCDEHPQGKRNDSLKRE